MHGRLKVKTSEEQFTEKLLEKQKKLKTLQLICSDVFQKRNEPLSPSLLSKTAGVLISNPDLYTFWNIRKEVLLCMKKTSPEEAKDLFKNELTFINECLMSNPKSYGSWQHRCFIMETMDMPDFKNELNLCSKFLESDNRNFHCWDYRRFIVKLSGELLESELDFTSTKISADFSNFSSWHYRSKLIGVLYSGISGQIDESILSKELSLVENAIYTDPNDQSGWFYHRWLLSKKLKKVSLQGVFVNRKSGSMMLLFSSALQASTFVKVEINGEVKQLCWKTANGRNFCRLIVTELNTEGSQLERSKDCELKVEIRSPSTIDGSSEIICKLESGSTFFSYITPHPDSGICPITQIIVEKQCITLRELHALEPDNKWTLRALALLTKSTDDSQHGEAIEYINKLIALDPYRTSHYKDLISKLKTEVRINQVNNEARSINLSGMSLTSIHCLERLCQMKSVDLSENDISSLEETYFLQSVEVLILHHNNISECTGIYGLPQLSIIDLSHNGIRCIEDLLPLSTCPKLQTLLIAGNPIACIPNHEELIKNIIPNIKHFY